MESFNFDDSEIDDSFDDIVAETRQSRFLTKEDIGKPDAKIDLTIAKAGRTMVDFNDGKGLHMETIILWKEEGYKPLIVRPTNAALIAQILRTRNPREWAGCQIGLWHRPDVQMAGKITGGIRACHPSQPKNGGKLRKQARLPVRDKQDRSPVKPEPDESIL